MKQFIRYFIVLIVIILSFNFNPSYIYAYNLRQTFYNINSAYDQEQINFSTHLLYEFYAINTPDSLPINYIDTAEVEYYECIFDLSAEMYSEYNTASSNDKQMIDNYLSYIASITVICVVDPPYQCVLDSGDTIIIYLEWRDSHIPNRCIDNNEKCLQGEENREYDSQRCVQFMIENACEILKTYNQLGYPVPDTIQIETIDPELKSSDAIDPCIYQVEFPTIRIGPEFCCPGTDYSQNADCNSITSPYGNGDYSYCNQVMLLAHELFHLVQFEIGHENCNNWCPTDEFPKVYRLYESMARYAPNMVFDCCCWLFEDNSVHTDSNLIFSTLDTSLCYQFRNTNTNPYSQWKFFEYLRSICEDDVLQELLSLICHEDCLLEVLDSIMVLDCFEGKTIGEVYHDFIKESINDTIHDYHYVNNNYVIDTSANSQSKFFEISSIANFPADTGNVTLSYGQSYIREIEVAEDSCYSISLNTSGCPNMNGFDITTLCIKADGTVDTSDSYSYFGSQIMIDTMCIKQCYNECAKIQFIATYRDGSTTNPCDSCPECELDINFEQYQKGDCELSLPAFGASGDSLIIETDYDDSTLCISVPDGQCTGVKFYGLPIELTYMNQQDTTPCDPPYLSTMTVGFQCNESSPEPLKASNNCVKIPPKGDYLGIISCFKIVAENCEGAVDTSFTTNWLASYWATCENVNISPNPAIEYSDPFYVELEAPGNLIAATVDGSHPITTLNDINSMVVVYVDSAIICIHTTTTIKYALISPNNMEVICIDSVVYTINEEGAPFMSFFPTEFSVDIQPSVLWTHQLYLKLGVPQEVDLEVGLYNISGRKLHGSTLSNLEAGWQIIMIAIPEAFPNGIYFLKVHANGNKYDRKVVLLGE